MKNFWKGKKVIVLGSAGFIGSHMVDLLVEKNAIVIAQVSTKTSSNKIKDNLGDSISKIKIVKADLEDLSSCIKILKGNKVAMNFAALDGGSDFKREHSGEIFKNNSQIVLNLLDSARINKIERFLIISSIEVYPDVAKQPIKEKSGFMRGLNEHIDGYAWSKRFSEIAAKMYSSQYGLKISIARLGNIYGPRDHTNKGRVIPTFIDQALKNMPISVWNGGDQRKSFLHVDDLVRSLLDLLELYPECDPVNIVSEKYITIRNLADKIIDLTDSRSKIKNIRSKLIMNERIISMNKAKKIIKFKEEIDIVNGLKSVVDS